MPLSQAAENARKKAGLSLLPKGPKGTNGTSHEFKSLFDPGKPATSNIGKFEPELLEFLRPKPEPDVEGHNKLKKRARQNTLGRMLGSIAQLGGVAAGGDAVRLEDGVNPYILGEMENMKAMEAEELSKYYDDLFRTDVLNNQTQNRFLGEQRGFQFQDQQLDKRNDFSRERQERGFEFQDEQLGKSQDFSAEEARRRAKERISEIYSRGQVDMNNAMADVGVNPKDPKAMEQFTQRMTEEFEYKMGKPYYAPRSIYNYGNGVGSRDPRLKDPEFMEKVRKGRQQELTKLRQQRNSIKKQPSLTQDFKNGISDDQREKEIEYIDQRIKLYEQVDVKPDDQITLDLYDIGNGTNRQPKKPPLPGAGPVTDFRGQFSPQQQEYSLQQGGSRTEPAKPTRDQQRNTAISTIGRQIQKNAGEISDFQNWSPQTAAMVKDMIDQGVEAGIFKDEEEAISVIIEGANQAK